MSSMQASCGGNKATQDQCARKVLDQLAKLAASTRLEAAADKAGPATPGTPTHHI